MECAGYYGEGSGPGMTVPNDSCSLLILARQWQAVRVPAGEQAVTYSLGAFMLLLTFLPVVQAEADIDRASIQTSC